MSIGFRAALVLMTVARYGFGDHVTNASAYRLRVLDLQRRRDVLRLVQDLDQD